MTLGKPNPLRPNLRHKASQNYAQTSPKHSSKLLPPASPHPSQDGRRYGFEALLKSLHEFALVVNSDGRIESVWSSNRTRPAAADETLRGRLFSEILDEEASTDLQMLQEMAAGKRPKERILYAAELADGMHWFAIWAIPGAHEAGGSTTFCLGARDITDREKAEAQLRQREALLEEAEKLAEFGSWELNLRTKKYQLSRHIITLFGFPPDDTWQSEKYWERVHPDDREQGRRVVLDAIAANKPCQLTVRYESPYRGWRYHLVRGFPVPGKDGKVDRRIGVLQDITERARVEKELHRLSQQLMRAHDDSRRHLARSLHESAGQTLAALKMTLGNLRDALPEGAELSYELLRSSVELAEEAIREVRTITYLMHPPLLDEAGLPSALRWYAEGFSKRSGIETTVGVTDEFGRYPQEIETTAFRIVQEALTNVHRYSGSKTAKITLAQEDGRVRAEVRDEGCGFALPCGFMSTNQPLGVGIQGMRERVAQLNGLFEIETAPGEGTTVRAILPVKKGQSVEQAKEMPMGGDEKPYLRRKAHHASC